MTVAAETRLPFEDRAAMLAFAAQALEDATQDDSYKLTPVGQEIAAYLDRRKAEGVEPHTVANWEVVFSRLALQHAHLALSEFDGRAGTRKLAAFLERNWGESGPGTFNAYLSVLKSFFKWAYHEEMLERDPTAMLKRRRVTEREYQLFDTDEVQRLIQSQPRLRDRCGILLLFDLALRRSELAAIQFKHMNLGENEITVFGKGGSVKRRPFRWEETRLNLERHILERHPHPDEFLLYPEKYGKRGKYPNTRWERIWDDRFRPLRRNGIRGWWMRCEENAGVPHRRQHEARHTAGTEVLRKTGNLELTRIYLRHKTIASTAHYMHLMESEELAAVFKRLAREAE